MEMEVRSASEDNDIYIHMQKTYSYIIHIFIIDHPEYYKINITELCNYSIM